MVKLKRVTVLDLIILLPFVGGSITAGDEETMQYRKKDGSLDVELETASSQKLLDNALAARLLPKPAEDESRPDVCSLDNRESTLGVRGKQEHRVSQARP